MKTIERQPDDHEKVGWRKSKRKNPVRVEEEEDEKQRVHVIKNMLSNK